MKVHQLFPSPVLVHDFAGPDIEEMNQKLLTSILARAATPGAPNTTKSNAGKTWHSDYTMPQWCPAVNDLIKHIHSAVMHMSIHLGAEQGGNLNFGVSPWAMVSFGGGDYAVPHTHPDCQISGVYYVSIGEPDPAYPYSGKIEFLNPTGFGQCAAPGLKGWARRQVLPPKQGRMLMFPAELLHMVHPYYGTGCRVAVAFNIHIKGYKPPAKEEEASNG